MQYFKEEEQSKKTERSPALLHYHDERSKRLHHMNVVDSLDVVNAEVCMMKKNSLFTLLYKQLNTNNFDTARTHQFLQYCSTDSLSCANVQRLLQLSMFESMPLTALDGSKSHTVTALPWDDPMTFTHNSHDLNTIQGGKAECDEQQENKISIKDLEKFRFRHYTHWNFTEHHNADVFPQVLQTASESYTCVDSFHSSQLNVMYVICHNPMSPARSSSGSWKASVHTDVSFRSYLENVAEFLRDWSIAEEERLHKQQQETEDTTLKGVSVMSPVPDKFEVFLRQDSLKAWKLEQDRQKDEELMKKTKKEKGKSSGQGADQERKMSQEDECHMPSFSTEQTKNKNEMNDMGDSGGAHTHIENQPGFTGFKMDGMLVQVKGESQCIYPSDGGQISVERVQYLQGSTWLKVCVTKNKHCFYTHIIEPERENTHDQPLKFGSFCALLSNGLRLAYSHKCQEGPEASPFQLHVCLPTGLQINFSFQQAAYGQAVLVRQTLPFSRAILSNTHTEFSRTITCNGAVIKHLRDGSTMILFADGTVSVSPDSGPVYVTLPTSAGQDEDPEQRQTGSTATKVKSSSGVGVEEEKPKAGVELKEQVKMRCGSWCTTTPSGVRIRTIRGEQVEEKPVLAFYSTDPQTPSLVMVMTRDDGVLCVMEKDRSVVEHADGTRITFSCQQRETLSQQHIDQEPVSAHSSGGSKNEGSVSTIKVENTGFATVRMRCEEKSGEVLFSDGTTISATAHGSYRVCLSDGGCLSIREDGAAEYNSTGPEVDQCVRYVMSHSAGLVCELTDTGGNHYQVTSEGSVSITHAHIDTERGTQHNTTPETHTPRLFMMYADGSALEFLSSHTVDEILQKENTQASVAVIREPAPHTPDAFEITILKPFSDLSSYWLSPKHLDDIIPANFKIRKWNALPVSEVKTRSSPFRSSLGQGLEVKEGAMPGSEPTPPVLQNSCTLLLRRITEHIPFTQQQYQHVQHKLLLYINDLLQQKKLKDEMSPRDPKAVEEKLHRSDLHCLPSPVGSAPGSSPQSMFSLYSQTLGVFHLLPLNQHSDQQETHCTKPKQSSAWLEKLQQHRSNVQEQRKHLYALRNHIIPPYFHSEHQETAHSLQQELEVKSGSHVLPSFPKRRNIKFKNLFQH